MPRARMTGLTRLSLIRLRASLPDVDEHDVIADFDDIFNLNEKFRPFRAKPTRTRYDEPQNPVFWITKNYIANSTKLSTVRDVDDFFGSK
jgi:hypothetical protein